MIVNRRLQGVLLMKPIKIFTDSAADLPQEFIRRYDVGVVPLLVSHAGEVYADGVDLTHSQFYQLLSQAEQLPTTSQPSPQHFIEAFSPYLEKDQEIVSINLSSNLSGTVESALLAREDFEESIRERIHIVDTLAASVGQGLLVQLAVEMAAAGKSAQEIVVALQEARPHLTHLFTLDTMDNLVKGGRISRSKATLGKLLNIKPILWLDEAGQIDTLDKTRGRKKALSYLLDKCSQEANVSKFSCLGICHADCMEEALEMQASLETHFPGVPIIVGAIGATIGTHTGAGCIAVFYFR